LNNFTELQVDWLDLIFREQLKKIRSVSSEGRFFSYQCCFINPLWRFGPLEGFYFHEKYYN